jgi:hypothetical protein
MLLHAGLVFSGWGIQIVVFVTLVLVVVETDVDVELLDDVLVVVVTQMMWL